MRRAARSTPSTRSRSTAYGAEGASRHGGCHGATPSADTVTTRSPTSTSTRASTRGRAKECRRESPHLSQQADRLAARRLLLVRPEPGRRDHPPHVHGDARAIPAHREAGALDDRDATGAAGDQEDPAEVQ